VSTVLTQVIVAVRNTLAEWWRLRWNELQLSEARTATLVLVVLLAICVLMLLIRRGVRSRVGRRSQVPLPALLPVVRRSPYAAARHSPFLLFALGIPFFAVALADPHTPFIRQEVTYPGRRIALLVDGSTSMALKFEGKTLRSQAGPAFYTAVAAAEHFVRLRMTGPYHDLIALIEFGNQAYVVTPFTTDYENVLLSLQLVGDPREWGRFEDYGTTIIKGISVGTQLFKSFDFLNASGNLMIVITDGRDDQQTLEGRQLDDLADDARRRGVPIYMIRVANNLEYGKVPQDRFWRAAVERTGGRFYAASDERAIIEAEKDIDKLSAGRIDLREYTSERPRFAGFTLIAVSFWLAAGALKLGLRQFRTFP
jgi:hypothetical protein